MVKINKYQSHKLVKNQWKRDYSELDRLQQRVMNLQIERAQVIRELQISQVWIKRAQWFQNIYDNLEKVTDSEMETLFIRKYSFGKQRAVAMIQNFVLPEYVLERHPGMRTRCGIASNGRTKRTVANGGLWEFDDHIIQILDCFKGRQQKLQKKMFILSETERRASRDARIIANKFLDETVDQGNPFKILDEQDRGTTADRFREKRQKMQMEWANRIQAELQASTQWPIHQIYNFHLNGYDLKQLDVASDMPHRVCRKYKITRHGKRFWVQNQHGFYNWTKYKYKWTKVSLCDRIEESSSDEFFDYMMLRQRHAQRENLLQVFDIRDE